MGHRRPRKRERERERQSAKAENGKEVSALSALTPSSCCSVAVKSPGRNYRDYVIYLDLISYDVKNPIGR